MAEQTVVPQPVPEAPKEVPVEQLIEQAVREEVIKEQEIKKANEEKDREISELRAKLVTFEKEKSEKDLEQKITEIAKQKLSELEPIKKVLQVEAEKGKEDMTVKPFSFDDAWNKAHGINQ